LIDSFDANFAPEAYLDASSLKYAQLRLALEQLLRKVKAAAHLRLVRHSAGTFVFHVALLVGMIAGLYDSAVCRTSYSRSMSKCRVATDEVTILLLLQFANVTGRLRPIYDRANCFLVNRSDTRTFAEHAIDALAGGLEQFTVSVSSSRTSPRSRAIRPI
jgi:hypothetical protein